MPVNDISGAIAAYGNVAKSPSAGAAGEGVNFLEMVQQGVDNSTQTLKAAEQAGIGALNGEVSLDELAVAIANAETTLQTVVAVRDRVIGAYQDIIKMPI